MLEKSYVKKVDSLDLSNNMELTNRLQEWDTNRPINDNLVASPITKPTPIEKNEIPIQDKLPSINKAQVKKVSTVPKKDTKQKSAKKPVKKPAVESSDDDDSDSSDDFDDDDDDDDSDSSSGMDNFNDDDDFDKPKPQKDLN